MSSKSKTLNKNTMQRLRGSSKLNSEQHTQKDIFFSCQKIFVIYFCIFEKKRAMNIQKTTDSTPAPLFVAYYRESTAAQKLGIDAQRTKCNQFANVTGGRIILEYVEHASGKDNDRPQLKAAAAKAKETGAAVLVARVDRLTRVCWFGMKFCQENAVRVADTPQLNSLILAVYFSLAQQERELISVRTREALQIKKANGEKLGRPKLKDGERGKYEKHKDTRKSEIASETLEKIDTLHRAGVKPSRIAKVLNDTHQGTARGGKWYTATIVKIIKRLTKC